MTGYPGASASLFSATRAQNWASFRQCQSKPQGETLDNECWKAAVELGCVDGHSAGKGNGTLAALSRDCAARRVQASIDNYVY